MPKIRNSSLFKKFTDFFQLKSNDFLSSEAGQMLVPVITHPILPLIVTFTPTEAEFASGIVVPAGKKWKLVAVNLIWTSDVTVGNRVIRLLLRDGRTNAVIGALASRNNQAASLIQNYNFGIGLSHVGSGSGVHQTIPLHNDFFLLEGSTIVVTDSASISGGDTLGDGWIIVEEEDLLESEVENDRAI